VTGEIFDDTEHHRLVIDEDGLFPHLDYRRVAKRLVLIHTEVPEELAGLGIGGRLVRAAAKIAADQDLVLVPLCAFARTWLEEHPDVAAGVKIDWGAQVPGNGSSRDART
jgi:predicted GNAT family acetyltransferase